VCQIARAHYFMIWFPTVMFVSLWLIREKHSRLAMLFAVVPVVLVVTHYFFLHTVGAMGALGLGTATWYSAVCLTVIWICSTKTRESDTVWHASADHSVCEPAIGAVNRKAA
jgi:hypothetical protein